MRDPHSDRVLPRSALVADAGGVTTRLRPRRRGAGKRALAEPPLAPFVVFADAPLLVPVLLPPPSASRGMLGLEGGFSIVTERVDMMCACDVLYRASR